MAPVVAMLADLQRFRERALQEAERYGSDPWVFVRELLQNARDARAEHVHFAISEQNGVAAIVCSDDGRGMSFEHARRYLFSLYASDKEGHRGQAGRFGVGFWSVLRLRPERIVVRSWSRGARGWEVELDPALTATHRVLPGRSASGTEVVLCGGRAQEAEPHLRQAAAACGRYLLRQGSRGPLQVLVNGHPVNVLFDLPAPSAVFHRGGMRGAVGLALEPRVELLAHGLSIRSASSLQDLLSPGDLRTAAGLPTAKGLAPQALLDSDGFDVLLARRDVRVTPAVERIIALASRELSRLIGRQLDLARPEPFGRRLGRWRRRVRPAWLALGLAAGIAFAAGLAWGGRRGGGPSDSPARLARSPPDERVRVPAGSGNADRESMAGFPRLSAYRDLAGLYEGARVDPSGDAPATLDLRYTPSESPRYFAAARVLEPGEGVGTPQATGAYQGPRCQSGCLSLELRTAGPSLLRLPVPTGDHLDPFSVRLQGRPAWVQATALGEPVLRLEASGGAVVTYRTGPALPEFLPAPGPDPLLPEVLQRLAAGHRARPVPERTVALTRELAQLVRYSRSPATVSLERQLAAQGASLATRALVVGAGDCDVQNGVLVLLFRQAGVPARLAIGYVGENGRLRAGLHAWVEFLGEQGHWRVADAALVLPSLDQSSPVPPTPAEEAESGRWLPAWLLLGTGGLLGVVGVAGLFLRRTRRQERLDRSYDAPRLLRGALEHPEAFAGAPALFDRELIPTLGRRRLGLGEANALAAEGQLFVSRAGSPLARRAARGGAWVVDAGTVEGRLAADSVGGIDLDAWDRALAAADGTPLTRALERALREAGERWDLRVATEPPEAGLLVLPTASLGAGFGSRCVALVQADSVWWMEAAERWALQPAEALFAAAERLAERLRLSETARLRLLRPLARPVLEEASR